MPSSRRFHQPNFMPFGSNETGVSRMEYFFYSTGQLKHLELHNVSYGRSK